MIQRIQTLYLFMVTLIAGTGVYLSFVQYTNAFNIEAKHNTYTYSLSIFLAICLISFLSIFLYKKRKVQFVLGRINIVLNFFMLGVFIYYSLTFSGEIIFSKKEIETIFPFISIFLLVMANKAIKKDEELVKSVNRLR